MLYRKAARRGPSHGHTAIGDTHKNVVKIESVQCTSADMLVDRHTYTVKQAHHNPSISLPEAE